jgi:hypothetical protein
MLNQHQRRALRGNALVTHADKARFFRQRMRIYALDWRRWSKPPAIADYAADALAMAVALRDAALIRETKSTLENHDTDLHR